MEKINMKLFSSFVYTGKQIQNNKFNLVITGLQPIVQIYFEYCTIVYDKLH